MFIVLFRLAGHTRYIVNPKQPLTVKHKLDLEVLDTRQLSALARVSCLARSRDSTLEVEPRHTVALRVGVGVRLGLDASQAPRDREGLKCLNTQVSRVDD